MPIDTLMYNKIRQLILMLPTHLPQYNIKLFKNEIAELPQYYFSYNNIIDRIDSLNDEFF